MKYYKATFRLTPYSEDFGDILSALLSENGFEAFEQRADGIEAYIQTDFWDEPAVRETLASYPIPGISIDFDIEDAEYDNWNRTWEEEGFKPIIIGDLAAIHNLSHTDIPPVRYDIVISPQQAFGTGSHQTTRMILLQLASMDLRGASVVDAGTGTGILSIMSVMKGAGSVFAYDIDEWSVSNTMENLRLNGIGEGVTVVKGDAACLKECHEANLLIANINRNILLSDMEAFRSTLASNGRLLLSGFYNEDCQILTEKAESLGMRLEKKMTDEDWAMLLFSCI